MYTLFVTIIIITVHPRSGVVYNFGRSRQVHICTCGVSPWSTDRRRIWIGHRVKVKVTGGKKVENSYTRNVRLRYNGNNSCSINHRAVMFGCSMGFSGTRIEWCNRHLCHVTGSEHAYRELHYDICCVQSFRLFLCTVNVPLQVNLFKVTVWTDSRCWKLVAVRVWCRSVYIRLRELSWIHTDKHGILFFF